MLKNGMRKMIGLALLGVLGVGCGNLEDAGAASTDEAALSAAPDGKGPAACGPAHDARKDRDHRFHKRCEHYNEKRPHRNGRGGNARLTTRALMDAQRTTTVEATTGAFDDDSVAPGRIDEMRVDVARTSPRCGDSRTITAKSSNASGYASMTIPKLVHGQSMTITARVSGIDRGVDVASVADEVRYRPDLIAGSIDVPAAVAVGVPTSIAATVREGAGDEGATADCVLSIDGAPADRVTGIWVDAAGMVTCHFTTRFASGRHQVAVDVMNVAPRDYDPTNNHADATVQATAQFVFSGSVIDAVYAGEDIEDVVDASGSISYHRDDTYSGRDQSVSVSGTWPRAVTFPLASLKGTASSSGTTWPLIDVSNVAADPQDGTGITCGSGIDMTSFNWAGVCTLSTDSGPATQISVSAFAGDVTYHSVGVCQTTSSFYDCASGYTWNSGSDPQPVSYHPIAGQLTVGLALVDAGGLSLSAAPSIPVAQDSTSSVVPRACDPQPDGSQHCTSHSYTESGIAGSAQQ